MTDPAALYRLRQKVAELDPHVVSCGAMARPLTLTSALDGALGGGVALGMLHELAPVSPLHVGTAAGFALALAARSGAGKPVLWIQVDFAGLEAGRAYGPGLERFGLPMRRLLHLRVSRTMDALWAAEEALKSRAVCAVVTELSGEGEAADLTASRRLVLAARDGPLALVLRHKATGIPSAAETRWEIAAAPGEPDVYGGLGPVAFDLTLTKNRRGPCGRWTLVWNHHDCTFQAISRGVAAEPSDRSDRAALVRTG